AGVQHDLQVLQNLYECSSACLSEWIQGVTDMPISPVVWYKEQEFVGVETFATYLQELDNWGDAVQELATYYRQCGSGLFAEYRALRWQAGQFIGIQYSDPIKLSALVGYESQRDALLKNT
ncbi:MAG: AAA+ family ATPase, partial [Nostoc sp.]